MRRFLILCGLCLAAFADERWISVAHGPFEVFTDAGARAGRETLARFEQLRNALGSLVGDLDLATPTPIRVLVFKNARELSGYPAPSPVVAGRDRSAVLLAAGAPVPAAAFRETTRLLLEANTARMPAPIERGLVALFSTLDVTGIKTILGRPVPAAERDQDWARVHLLATDSEYYGKLRVLIYNLRRGVDPEAAYRNAVGRSPAEIDQQAARYLAEGHFPTVDVPSRPMSVEHDFPEKAVSPEAARLALADLLLPSSRPAYEKMIQDKTNLAEAWEGLGMLALRASRPDEARADFAHAMDAGAESPHAFIEYARLEPDNAKAAAALEKAVKLNPKLAEPYALLAEHDTDLDKRIAHLEAAVKLDARHALWWRMLAESYLTEKKFAEAAKAWRGGEQAATDDAERARMRIARLSIEQQRLDYEAAERRRVEEEMLREIERLKTAARAELHAAESKANQGSQPAPAGDKVVPWWDGPKPPGHAAGMLKQVDCLGKQARLVVETDDHKTIRLLIPDASQVAIVGGGERSLGCGRRPPRRVAIDYFPKNNSRLATAGEVATIEFQ